MIESSTIGVRTSCSAHIRSVFWLCHACSSGFFGCATQLTEQSPRHPPPLGFASCSPISSPSGSPLFVSTFELSELPTLAGEASLPHFGGLTVGVAAFRRVGRPARPCEVPEVRRAADFRLRVGRSAQPRPPQAFGRSAQPRPRRWHVLRHGAAHRRRAPGVGARSPPARRSLGRPAPETPGQA